MTRLSTPDQRASTTASLPDWVPRSVWAYAAHAIDGRPLRSVAEEMGIAPSTVLRKVRRLEAQRDDPLIDDVFSDLESTHKEKESRPMSHMPARATLIDEETLNREARRVLRRLCEADAILAVGQGMPQAVVLREGGETPTRTATVPREVAQAFVLKDWVSAARVGRVTRYRITEAGRAALRRLLGDTLKAKVEARGMAEAPSPFLTQHRIDAERIVSRGDGTEEVVRVNLAESPLGALARRREKGGEPFLSLDLVVAGERLREDFELSQMGPRVGQDWAGFLTSGVRSAFQPGGGGGGSEAARARVHKALTALGPGLGDVVLRVCCFLEGLEAAEKRMGWSARSGKIVLRIALQRLKAHYDGLAA
jgi:DNA-binding MarR family transcriptional regulator